MSDKPEDIIIDIHFLENELQKYEKKYNIISELFYKLYHAGVLEEDWDFQEWSGYFEAYQYRKEMFKKLVSTDSLSRLSINKDSKKEVLELIK